MRYASAISMPGNVLLSCGIALRWRSASNSDWAPRRRSSSVRMAFSYLIGGCGKTASPGSMMYV